jgi:phenylalanyl-tRNA synthetase beta chain
MPKIEVNEKALHKYFGQSPSVDQLEQMLIIAKGEVDGVNEAEGTLKLEFNDTNRPDLWSTAGAGRQLRIYHTHKIPTYDFLSTVENPLPTEDRVIKVDSSVKDVRPFIVGFAVTGKKLDEFGLADLIQTQEKLCWNYGQKRKAIAMGVYRSDLIQFPVLYKGVDPDKAKFVPLGLGKELSLREMVKEHPKGQEFGHIVAQSKRFPLLTDSRADVLSFPPVINSDRIGAVEAGDENLFIELTGTDIHSLMLTANIVACDLSDAGFTILPVKIEFPYDTPLGKEVVCPLYFQEPAKANYDQIKKLLGPNFTKDEITSAATRMGLSSTWEGEDLLVRVPEYRNDFLHAVDVIEDIMVGYGMDNFPPIFPTDYTLGRLTPEEEFGRKVRDLMIGLGFQEMIYNYLGSYKTFVEKMNRDGSDIVQILNPMTENYEFVRNSILPLLLESESISAHAVYPHNIFEVGKIAFLDESDNYGSVSRNALGFMSAHRDAGFTK